MSVALLVTGLLGLFRSEVARNIVYNVLGELICDASQSPLAQLAQRWKEANISNNDLERALKRAYREALGAIALGLSGSQEGPRAWVQRKVSREFAANFEERFFVPFADDVGLDEVARPEFRRKGKEYCRLLSEAADQVLDMGDLTPYETVAHLLFAGGEFDLSQAEAIAELSARAGRELMDSMRGTVGVPERFCQLLAYAPRDGTAGKRVPLLLGATVYFFREEIKANSRVRDTLTHLSLQELRVEQAEQRQALAEKLSEIKKEIAQLGAQGTAAWEQEDFSSAQEFARRGQVLQRKQEGQQGRLQEAVARLERVPQAEAVIAAIDAGMARYEEVLGEIKTLIITGFDDLKKWLREEFETIKEYLERIEWLIRQDRMLGDLAKERLEAGLSTEFDLHAKYEFDEERDAVGYGAVGVVYRAVHKGLQEVRALKVLKPEHRRNEETVERFLREGIALAELHHSHIVRIHDAGGGGEKFVFYLDMEFVEGKTLYKFIKQRRERWDEQLTLKLMRQLASAVEHMHEQGIIHRDLSSHNVVVQPHGDLKVMDFGVAKLLDLRRITREGQVVGSAAYMAPEQGRGERVDRRADIYSFGVIVYELCAGCLPSKPPQPLRQHQPEAPEWLEKMLSKCLADRREKRYGSMAEVLEEIERRGSSPQDQRGGRTWPKAIRVMAIVEALVLLGYWSLNQWVKVPFWALLVFLILSPVLVYLVYGTYLRPRMQR